jgi:subtilisin family serine protease
MATVRTPQGAPLPLPITASVLRAPARAVPSTTVKVLGDNGNGSWSWISNGIVWAADNGAKVISMSLGGHSGSSTVQNAVNYAWSKGVVVVAAAGNDGNTTRNYPAYYTNAIAVAATNDNDAKASFSNYGSWVDVAAPGVSILSTKPSGYGRLSGTSMATPHVAGVAGLVWSTGLCGTTDNACVRTQIEALADPISGIGSYWTYGRINAARSLFNDTTAPAQSFVPSSTLGNKIPIKLSWTATDSGGSGVARYQLQQSTNGGAYSNVSLPSSTTTDISLDLRPNYTYRFRVAAQDRAGNWTSWAEGPSFNVSAYQENNTAISYSDTWWRSRLRGAYGRYVKYANTSAATARFTFTGSAVAWVAPKARDRGQVEVYVDDVYQTTVDLYSYHTYKRQVAFAKGDLDPSASHTIELRLLGTEGRPRVDVDAFVVLWR